MRFSTFFSRLDSLFLCFSILAVSCESDKTNGEHRKTYVVRYKNKDITIPVTVVLDYRKQAEYVINMNPRTPTKSVTFYDFKQKSIAYKDMRNRECFIGKLNGETLRTEEEILKRLKNPVESPPMTLDLDVTRPSLTPTEVRNIAGQKIAMFCRKMGTWVLQQPAALKRNRRQAGHQIEKTYRHHGQEKREYSSYGYETYKVSQLPSPTEQLQNQAQFPQIPVHRNSRRIHGQRRIVSSSQHFGVDPNRDGTHTSHRNHMTRVRDGTNNSGIPGNNYLQRGSHNEHLQRGSNSEHLQPQHLPIYSNGQQSQNYNTFLRGSPSTNDPPASPHLNSVLNTRRTVPSHLQQTGDSLYRHTPISRSMQGFNSGSDDVYKTRVDNQTLSSGGAAYNLPTAHYSGNAVIPLRYAEDKNRINASVNGNNVLSSRLSSALVDARRKQELPSQFHSAQPESPAFYHPIRKSPEQVSSLSIGERRDTGELKPSSGRLSGREVEDGPVKNETLHERTIDSDVILTRRTPDGKDYYNPDATATNERLTSLANANSRNQPLLIPKQANHRADIPSEDHDQSGFSRTNLTGPLRAAGGPQKGRLHNVLQLFTPDEIVIDVGKIPKKPEFSPTMVQQTAGSFNTTLRINGGRSWSPGRAEQSSGTVYQRTYDPNGLQPTYRRPSHHRNQFVYNNRKRLPPQHSITPLNIPQRSAFPPGVSVYPRHPNAPFAELGPSAESRPMVAIPRHQIHRQRHLRKKQRTSLACCASGDGTNQRCCNNDRKHLCCASQGLRGNPPNACCEPSRTRTNTRRRPGSRTGDGAKLNDQSTPGAQTLTAEQMCDMKKMCRTLYQSTQAVKVCKHPNVPGC